MNIANQLTILPTVGFFFCRCSECGCPGCLSVYNSITTNIYAAEKRIMGRVDAKLQALLENMNSRFDNLFESLLLRQEQMLLGFQSTPKNSFSSSRKYPQRNGHKGGDTSVQMSLTWDLLDLRRLNVIIVLHTLLVKYGEVLLTRIWQTV